MPSSETTLWSLNFLRDTSIFLPAVTNIYFLKVPRMFKKRIEISLSQFRIPFFLRMKQTTYIKNVKDHNKNILMLYTEIIKHMTSIERSEK